MYVCVRKKKCAICFTLCIWKYNFKEIKCFRKLNNVWSLTHLTHSVKAKLSDWTDSMHTFQVLKKLQTTSFILNCENKPTLMKCLTKFGSSLMRAFQIFVKLFTIFLTCGIGSKTWYQGQYFKQISKIIRPVSFPSESLTGHGRPHILKASSHACGYTIISSS